MMQKPMEHKTTTTINKTMKLYKNSNTPGNLSCSGAKEGAAELAKRSTRKLQINTKNLIALDSLHNISKGRNTTPVICSRSPTKFRTQDFSKNGSTKINIQEVTDRILHPTLNFQIV